MNSWLRLGRTILALTAAITAWWEPALEAQWINHPTPGIPRTREGKPNLNAPAPKAPGGKPDLSGIWLRVRPPNVTTDGFTNNGVDHYMAEGAKIPYQPWAEELFKQRYANYGTGRPSERCLPHGIPDAMLPGAPFKLVQNQGLTLILYEEFNHYRQIFTDGRSHPKDPNPAWFGYSIGKWEGNALVVDSVGFNDQTWLDDSGRPHTDALHTIERFERRDFGHMDLRITIDDSKAYTSPWSLTLHLQLLADTELIEDVCDNERDYSHITSK